MPPKYEALSTEELIDVMSMLEDARDHYTWLRKDAHRRQEWSDYDEKIERAQQLIDKVNVGISCGLADVRTLAELEGERDVAIDTLVEYREGITKEVDLGYLYDDVGHGGPFKLVERIPGVHEALPQA